MDNYADTLRNYYEIKEKYDNQIKKRKSTIKENPKYTFKEKKTNLKKIIGNCVNCNQKGGTIFEEKNGMLKAVCGSKSQCKLNINIKRKYYDNARELEIKYNKTTENLKMRIIMTKLDHLFQINNSKEETIDKFNTLKEELGNVTELLMINTKKYGDIINDNYNVSLVNNENIVLANEVDELKKMYKEYLENSSSAYITSMMEKHVTIIIPLLEKIRNMKYSYIAIETNDEQTIDKMEYKYIARPYLLEQIEQERQ
jgi:hypothetical protein